MESRAKLAGHAVHPMLITVPLGLLGTAVVFDLLDLLTDADTLVMAAFYTIAAGILGGLLAAVFGLWDWLAIPAGTRARRIGLWRGLGNAVALVCSRWSGSCGADRSTTSRPAWHCGWRASRCWWRWRLPGRAASWWNGWAWEWTRAHTWTLPAPCVARP
jgi:hypothetical protein